MRVFISWSQDKEKSIALVLKQTFELFFNAEIEFWVSSVDIKAGMTSVSEIINSLKESDMSIVCLDKSNFTKNWLYFETGFIYGKNYTPESDLSIVYPLIFDNTKIEDFANTPFKELQLKYFDEDITYNMLDTINELFSRKENRYCVNKKVFDNRFKSMWHKLCDDVNNIIQQKTVGGDNMLTEENVTKRILKYGFENPKYGDVIEYSKGFETNSFYSFLLNNVSKRLYIWGRKNRKLTDRSFDKDVLQLVKNNVDLRIMYLNPNSSTAKTGIAQDLDGFKTKLIFSIKEFAKRLTDNGYDMGKYCRMYDGKRNSEMIIADDVVFYKDLAYAADGTPLHFTDANFYITSINSELGSIRFKKFEELWCDNEKNKITQKFIESLPAAE